MKTKHTDITHRQCGGVRREGRRKGCGVYDHSAGSNCVIIVSFSDFLLLSILGSQQVLFLAGYSNTLRTAEMEFCSYWIKRKQRKCSHRVADGNTDGLCSEHSASGMCAYIDLLHLIEITQTGLMESRNLAEQTRYRSECNFVLKNIVENVAQSCGGDDGCAMEGSATSRKRKRNKKRTSAPKRMANPFRYVCSSSYS